MAENEAFVQHYMDLVGMDRDEAIDFVRKAREAREDLATFKGPLDGLTNGEQVEEIGKMLEADRICFANLEQVSSDVLTRMAARTE